jgi:hypothetical protein
MAGCSETIVPKVVAVSADLKSANRVCGIAIGREDLISAALIGLLRKLEAERMNIAQKNLIEFFVMKSFLDQQLQF